MINTFEPKLVGNTITMTTKFYDSSNLEVLPNTVTLKYKKPNGTLVTENITRVGDRYSFSVFLNESGIWHFRWECSGIHASAEEFTVNVRPSTLD